MRRDDHCHSRELYLRPATTNVILALMKIDGNNIVLIYVTFPDQKSATELARTSIEQKLAACANVFAPHISVYRWNQKVETATETAVIFKTSRRMADKLRHLIDEHHDYDVPCIVTLDPSHVAKPFSDWIHDSVESD